MIADSEQRARARDPARSVIVQAPAGSGKTELLTQRYLALLAHVDEPEHVLAVTFTRKAAAEMRHRVLRALQAQDGSAPDARLPETAELARAVAEQSERRGWRLAEHPARLRIRTFDSLSHWLAAAAPVSDSRGAALGSIVEQPDALYEAAARRALELLDDADFGPALTTVVRYLDNRTELFVRLMAQMLAQRDQWLPLLGRGLITTEARAALEAGLRALVQHELEGLAACMPLPMRVKLTKVLPYAGACLETAGNSSPLVAWAGCTEFPAADPDALPLWQALPAFFLTAQEKPGPEFRLAGGVNKKLGFATPKEGGDAALKDAAKQLVASAAGDAELLAALGRVRALPAPAYSDAQWAALAAFIKVLPLVAAELELLFNQRGTTDYVQVARQALAALGSDGAPTGLALTLDYQIQHILIDEFQDTSRTQLALLQELTRGWTSGDGRSLMLVGDPMQSIYRFRQADVSLFLNLWDNGLGDLPLEPITLSCNFRSVPAVVDWVNATFSALMPAAHDPTTGAVRFAPGVAQRAGHAASGVRWHRFFHPGRVDEARCVADLVEAALQENSSDRIGILVRTRNQARLIAPELRARGIAFAGAGLEQPGETAVEQDLIALTRALSQPGDRVAWLALLRAPWCGLSLADLDALVGNDWDSTVLELLRAPERLSVVSADGRERIGELCEQMSASLARKGELALRDWVEGAWQRLGGPAFLQTQRELELAEQFFQQLEAHDEGGDIAAAFDLYTCLPDRQDSPTESAARVQLLTLFKAKGLEYDVVILPALDGSTRNDSRQMIAAHEYFGPDGATEYLLAPLEAPGQPDDPLARLIRGLQAEQRSHELDRLLYVAATRAKRWLHICHELKLDKDGKIAAPRRGSLLARLWPVIEADCAELSGPPGTSEQREAWVQLAVRRREAGWQPVPPPPALPYAAAPLAADGDVEVTYDWAGSDAMRIGRVVHRCLQHVAERGLTQWRNGQRVAGMLTEEGVEAAQLAGAAEQVNTALQATLRDERGRWLVADHREAAVELPVTVLHDGRPERLVIDRTFVADDGVRWVVDYKTSRHEGADIDVFIDREVERYTPQLMRYVAALRLLDPGRPVRAALYFPLLGVFRELPDVTVG